MDVTYRRVSAYARNMGVFFFVLFFVSKKVYVYNLSWHIDIFIYVLWKNDFFRFCFVFNFNFFFLGEL